ncbi:MULTISPECIES: SigB/SigF/SigG family RNA polymerase sigma factor [Catenuloplanes]|uniref:RNA polymerase sigma-B factor n=1 Tax=Catenuloplanes niger TaxID=587534 RepID=A0AAE4CQD9_9ACTN|nr:SigB/SigF/SigG family RNA polymerase sigma factor [Catenuloplanes niger]MDR7320397.1 RNA polymerase sigma-B factor [Catenuloplanes niger]
MSSTVTVEDLAVDEDTRATQALAAFTALEDGDRRRPQARQRAIEAWLPMANRLARRFTGRGAADEDLRQVAAVGLIKAIDRYDPAAGEFVGFAVPTVLGELRRYFRDRTWSVRVPRRVQEMRLAIIDAATTLTQSLGRSPTVPELAAHLRVTEEQVIEGIEGAQAYSAVSLSRPVADDGDSKELGDLLGGDDPGFDLTESLLDLGPALRALSPREREIISLRFYQEWTQARIGEHLGISQMHVSRLLQRALTTLRTRMQAT